MNWRSAMGVVAGALLPVPLMLVLLTLWPKDRPPSPEAARVSPVLSFEERMQRVTYHRHCQKETDCERPMGCLCASPTRSPRD